MDMPFNPVGRLGRRDYKMVPGGARLGGYGPGAAVEPASPQELDKRHDQFFGLHGIELGKYKSKGRPPYSKRRLPAHVNRALSRCLRGATHPHVEGQLALFGTSYSTESGNFEPNLKGTA